MRRLPVIIASLIVRCHAEDKYGQNEGNWDGRASSDIGCRLIVVIADTDSMRRKLDLFMAQCYALV